ncbi:alpha-ribazole phosphatase family protein [Candidatus Sulfurimonas baltica]|uniref:Alpha-ribazole phosphatase family protein n=1 Tax=Candidatus Sulfurimonas baltica TaxID=2740404 RepID=A0A7S7RN54_9BACT|nr:alpha-ribazole phosphatase family protein [Candidatus Sulfurimonas baltica]QOY52184.1 alpha-ribazole phosphatase family protein [Candidatus Sulfurimonas baltica]
MQITLVRHAEVDGAYLGCYNGHNDIGLSLKGHEQAKELAKSLDSLNFDALFCSDLLRAKESIKYSAHVKNIIYTDKLREKSWGKHEGMRFDDIIAQKEIEYIDFLQWINALDGEPYEEYIKRVREFFLEYLPALNKEHILVVTHAGVVRVFLSIIKNITLEEAFSIKIDYGDLIIENI